MSSPATAAPEPIAVPAIPQSNVVYVQPPATTPRETNWGPWVAVLAIVLLVGGGLALWNSGYLGGGNSYAPPASSVTIDNSPQMTSENPPNAAEPVASTTPAPTIILPAVLPPAAPLPAAQPPATPTPAPETSKTPAIDIISVKGQALEQNSIEWKYGYTLRLRNNTASAVTSDFRIQFLDAQGFPVDDDVLSGLVIPANMELSFDGEDMIKAPLAERIQTLLAEAR